MDTVHFLHKYHMALGWKIKKKKKKLKKKVKRKRRFLKRIEKSDNEGRNEEIGKGESIWLLTFKVGKRWGRWLWH